MKSILWLSDGSDLNLDCGRAAGQEQCVVPRAAGGSCPRPWLRRIVHASTRLAGAVVSLGQDENEVRLQECTVRKRSKISPRGCHYSSWTQIVLSETGSSQRGEGMHNARLIYISAVSQRTSQSNAKANERRHGFLENRRVSVISGCGYRSTTAGVWSAESLL